jgi:hypothetical protein
MNILQINAAILNGGFTNDQLTSIIDAVKFARARLGRQSIRSLRVGDAVGFTSTKLGQHVTGVVTKIAIKYVTVKTAAGLWKVPANMLSLVEDREFA